MKRTARHYANNPESRAKKKAYDSEYGARPEQKKRRAKRNKDRRQAEREGRVKKDDGKDVHHANGIHSSSTRVMSASANRGVKEKSRLKGSKRKKR